LIVLRQPDPVGANANTWLRRKNKVKIQMGSSTLKIARDELPARVDLEEVHRPAPTPEQAAALGGADGGAGHQEQVSKRDPNELIREAVGLRKMRKQGF
jgi:hypothetical protein